MKSFFVLAVERQILSPNPTYPHPKADISYRYAFVFPWNATATCVNTKNFDLEVKEAIVGDPVGYNLDTAKKNISLFGVKGEHAVFVDTLMYFPEHVWQQPISKYQYHLISHPLTQELRLVSQDSAQPDIPVLEIFQRGIEYRIALGQNPSRETAEVTGFTQIEAACIEAARTKQNLSFLWFSPPSTQIKDYGTSGRTFMGHFDYQSGVLQIFNLIDNFTNTDREQMWHHFGNLHQLQQRKFLISDLDFLVNPNIILSSDLQAADIVKFIDDWLGTKYGQKHILGKPEQQYDPNHQKALYVLEPYLKTYIEEFIDLIKTGATKQQLNAAFHALTVLAQKLFTQYIQDPEKPILRTVSNLDTITKQYRYYPVVVTETACPINLKGNYDPAKPFAYLNELVGPNDDFYCEVCGTKIKFGSGAKECPTCHTPAVCT